MTYAGDIITLGSKKETNIKQHVTFGLNVRLDLSREATTKSLGSLCAQPGFEILGESAGTVAIRVIRGVSGAWEMSQAYAVVQGSLRGSV